jgi:predicted Zn-dependent protease
VAEDRVRGQALLAKWASDPDWGVDALRALLADAVAHRDRGAATRWAEGLRMNRRCTLGDIPVCLQALADSDTAAYQAMLGPLEDQSRSNPTRAAVLLGWLTQIGRGEEAVRWGQSLEPADALKPPIAPGIAEALRATQRWPELQAWVDKGDWGRDLGFMQWAYGLLAAQRLGDKPREDSLWASLRDDGIANPAHALFAGDALIAWGLPREAAELLWSAADRADLAYQALGSLARLYQVQGDAEGQYRAFSRLNAMRPYDRKIANNFAYFAALTDLGSQTHVEPIAKDNFTHEPGNAVFRSTYAFVLVWSGQASRAMKLMVPVSRDWKKSPAVAFAYGAALAGLGRKAEAREVFGSLDPRSLDPKETDWIQAALR